MVAKTASIIIGVGPNDINRLITSIITMQYLGFNYVEHNMVVRYDCVQTNN